MTDQMVLVDVTKEVDGIEMGVLRDGTAYLTGRGVARLCGAAVSTIINQKDEWSAGRRNNKFARLLLQQGYDEAELFIPVQHDGRPAYAYPEAVCMAFLEYFAFESPSPSVVAQSNFRRLARGGMRLFVYTALGYTQTALPLDWQKFHDRVLLASAPIGYFSVFKEISEFVIGAIRGGLRVDEHSIPDISVGQQWAKFWADSEFASVFGDRAKWEHNYPDYFPQAASNPQEIWVYPVQSLGEFRVWLQRTYIPQKFPNYLSGKVKRGALPPSTAEMLVAQATAPALRANDE